MPLLEILIIFSSLSFLGYGIAYFTTTNMKVNLFAGLGKFGTLLQF
jgi:hypothetical protein